MRSRILLLFTALLPLAACGGGDDAPAETTAPPAAEAPAAAPAAPAEPAVAYDGPPAEVTITPLGNEMKYEVTEFTVAPGQPVTLTFNNTATSPTMSHNVVVLKKDANVNAVGQAAMSASDTEYIPENRADQILAHTPLAAPGETVEVTFTAPSAPGDYTYICTFPGHFMAMQGTMRVVAS